MPEIGYHMIDRSNKPLKVLIVGAGAIGTYIGAHLLSAENEVIFLERPDSARKIEKTGIILTAVDTKMEIKGVKVGTSINEVFKFTDYDMMIIAIKAFDTEALISDLERFRRSIPTILCLQNGVENEELYIRHFGSEKVIYGSVTSAISRIQAGEAVVEKERGVAIGTKHTMAKRVIACFNHAGLLTIGYSDGVAIKWSKMMTNLLANASSAVLNMLPIDIYKDDRLLKIEIKQIQETLEVMRVLGIHPINLPKAPVRLLVYALTRLPFSISQYLMIRLMGKGRGEKIPSLLIDMKLGRQVSEINYLNGAIARIGSRLGVETPINRKLTQTLMKMLIKTSDIKAQPMRIEQFLEVFNS